MKASLLAGLAMGGLWAFVEVAFAYVTGSTPTGDVIEILVVPLTASLLYHATAAASFMIRPHRVFEALTPLALLLAPLTYLAQGRFSSSAAHIGMGLLPFALALPLLIALIRRPTERGWFTPGRMVWVLLVHLAAASAYAVRADRVSAITTDMLFEVFTFVAALGIAAAGIQVWQRRWPAPALFILTVAASVGVAFFRGSAPPAYEAGPDTRRPLPEGTRPPNVLLIVMDTVRASNLDLHGHTRPTLARTGAYLKDGLILDAATASGTYSLPSHGSLFTGLLPSAHGAHSIIGGHQPYGRAWPDIETLAAWLKARGYATVGMSANDVFLLPWTGLQKGFDTFVASSPRGLRFRPLSAALRKSAESLRRLPFRLPRRPDLNWSAVQVTDMALDVVAQTQDPFFLFLNYFDAHDPHVRLGTPPWSVPSPAKEVDAYDTEIAYIDGEIARLLGFLEQKGRLDQTLVIVTSDHGEYFGERKLRGHPAAPYQLSLHVPLALRLPGVVPSGRSARRTGLHEVFRMIRNVVEDEPIGWLRETDPAPRILSEAWALTDYPKVRPADKRPSTTIVFAGNLKLIHRLSGRSELFDLDADPGEKNNLIDATDPSLVALKEKMILEVMLRVTRGPGSAPSLSEDAAERMRALGYLR